LGCGPGEAIALHSTVRASTVEASSTSENQLFHGSSIGRR
jgi:hypothetical protein